MKPAIILVFLLITLSCSEKEFDPDKPDESYVIAKEPYDDENYEIAIKKLGEFKSRFPYSHFSVEAELLLANSHFELDHYEEAAASYKQFIKLHPTHAKVPFAYYRVGESYWAKAPEEVDREPELTQKAIEEWGELAKRFPTHELTQKAAEYVVIGKRRIMLNRAFVAKFYCKQKIWHSCVFRYMQIVEIAKEKDILGEALVEVSRAWERLADEMERAAGDKNILQSNLYFRSMTPAAMRAKAQELSVRAQQL